MDLVNGEEQAFGFFIVQSSLLCDDQQSSLTVHPMTGTLAPKDRSVTLPHNSQGVSSLHKCCSSV